MAAAHSVALIGERVVEELDPLARFQASDLARRHLQRGLQALAGARDLAHHVAALDEGPRHLGRQPEHDARAGRGHGQLDCRRTSPACALKASMRMRAFVPALAQAPVRLLVGEAARLPLVNQLLLRGLRLRALALQLPHLERGLVGRDLLGQDLRLAHQPLLGQLLVLRHDVAVDALGLAPQDEHAIEGGHAVFEPPRLLRVRALLAGPVGLLVHERLGLGVGLGEEAGPLRRAIAERLRTQDDEGRARGHHVSRVGLDRAHRARARRAHGAAASAGTSTKPLSTVSGTRMRRAATTATAKTAMIIVARLRMAHGAGRVGRKGASSTTSPAAGCRG